MKNYKINLSGTSNAKQMEFFRDDQSKLLHLSGGFGSGKSFMLVAKLLKLSMLNKNIRGGVVCPDFSEYRKDLRPALIELLDMHRIKYHEHKSHSVWRFPWSNKEVQVVSAEKRIRGPNWGFAVINELTLMPLVRYQETIARVRIKGAPCPQIASSGTPEGFANDYYEYLIENPKPSARVITVSTRENVKNLGEDYIKMLENTFDATQQAAYIDGEWVNMTTNRFYYKYEPRRHDDPTIEFHEDEDDHGFFPQIVHVSMDFNVNPMSANFWQQREIVPKLKARRIVAFDEINIKGDADTQRMCIAMIANGYTPDRCIVYADPAGQWRSTKGAPDKKILESHGFVVKCRASAPRFRQRMLNAANLFDKEMVSINPDKCPELKKDLLNNSFDQSNYEKIKDQALRTHHSDGMDYMFDILYPFSGNRDGISSVTIR